MNNVIMILELLFVPLTLGVICAVACAWRDYRETHGTRAATSQYADEG